MKDFYDQYQEEKRPRHRKMSVSKKTKHKKADHKHQYANCGIKYAARDGYGKTYHLLSMGQYCTLCGKLECNWMKGIDVNKAHLSPDIPVFEANMWDKTIQL